MKEATPKKSILCIDDNLDLLEVLTLYLEEAFEVTCLNDATQALELLEERDFDLIFCDIFMPGMDGLQFIEELSRDECFQTPIIAMSGGGSSGKFVGGIALETAMRLGAESTLFKPFNREDLQKCIQSVFRNQRRKRPSDSESTEEEEPHTFTTLFGLKAAS